MSKKPTISVIIPVYNRERYIGRCLRSLLNQTIDRDFYEIITINDGSTDQTDKILKSFIDEIKIYSKKKNSGLSKALNYGLRKAKGKFIVRVDSDDYVNKEFLKVLYLFLDSNSKYDAIACDYFLVNDKEKVLKKIDCLKQPIACGIMFRTKHLKDIGFYNPNYLINEEIELRKRFEQKYKINRVAIPLYRYRRHKTNLTKNDFN
tara:strand:+ start:166 stop:780 length:615 start_codon:yes stop_codon:yes gene_type:complete